MHRRIYIPMQWYAKIEDSEKLLAHCGFLWKRHCALRRISESGFENNQAFRLQPRRGFRGNETSSHFILTALFTRDYHMYIWNNFPLSDTAFQMKHPVRLTQLKNSAMPFPKIWSETARRGSQYITDEAGLLINVTIRVTHGQLSPILLPPSLGEC